MKKGLTIGGQPICKAWNYTLPILGSCFSLQLFFCYTFSEKPIALDEQNIDRSVWPIREPVR